jgi:hypothetical protein
MHFERRRGTGRSDHGHLHVLHDLWTRGRVLKFKFWRTVSLGNKNQTKERQLAEKLPCHLLYK